MRTKEIKLYTYDELSDEAKGKARDWYREGALDYEWWESVFEDAANVGLRIKEFDIDRGSYVKAVFMASAEETAHKIEKEHGESCETFTDAKNYLKERDALIDTTPTDEDGEYALDRKLDDMDAEFLRTLQEDYRITLQKEYEYLLSDESVEESIIANEYEFTIDGKRA